MSDKYSGTQLGPCHEHTVDDVSSENYFIIQKNVKLKKTEHKKFVKIYFVKKILISIILLF